MIASIISLWLNKKRGGGEDSTWKTIIDDTRFNKFGVDDSSGITVLEIRGVDVKIGLDRKEESSGLFDGADSQQKMALYKYGKTSKGLIFEKKLKYEERYLKEGDEIYVLGEVNDFDGYKPIFRSGTTPLLVSHKSKDESIHEYKIKSLLFAIAVVALLVAEVYFLIFQ